MVQTQEFISVYFKLARSEHTKNYLINPFWTISELYQHLQPLIESDFQLTKFELVETGQNIPGTFAEDSKALNPEDNLVLWSKFGHKLNTSFYIRPKIPMLYECDRCSEIEYTMSCFGCNHQFCYRCIGVFRERNVLNETCPACRV